MASWLRILIGAFAVLFVGAFIVRCDPIAYPTDFGYRVHLRPRVFAAHEPLIPAPGSTVTIRVAPDLPAGTTVQRAVATLRGATNAEQNCVAQGDGTFTCRFTLGGDPGSWVYGARIELSDDARVFTPSEYRFTALASLPADTLIEVRVPTFVPKGVADTYRVDLAWVRDPSGFSEEQFVAAAREAMFAGILADPVYRWRDNQLGFYVFTRPGLVESYYVPRDTRCGRNPWPGDAALPAALNAMEAMGVLHRKSADSDGIEGSGVAPANVAFRDCAGRAVRRPALGTFSANAAIGAFVQIAKHEFGHAAFALGEEYSEDQSTRNVPPPLPALTSPCCCKVAGSGSPGGVGGGIGGTIGGVGGTGAGGAGGGVGIPVDRDIKRCAGVGGVTEVAVPPGDTTPACAANEEFPAFCGAGPDSGCPSLAGTCVGLEAWLAAAPPAGNTTARPNVFASQPACEDARQKAADHPAIEDASKSLGACRQICGAGLLPCPCGGIEFWIVDRDPPANDPAAVDTMGVVAAAPSLQGGTCQWCVETSLCVRWHRARGDDDAATWGKCEAPSKQAPRIEQLQAALIAWINDLVERIQRVVIF